MNEQNMIQVQFQPLGIRVRIPRGTDLLTASLEAGLDLNSSCGGSGSCGQCRVQVLEGAVSPLTEDESFILTNVEQFSGERLACCTDAYSDVVVEIPRGSMIIGQRLQLEGDHQDVATDPFVGKYRLTVPQPTMQDTRSDSRRLRDALEHEAKVVAQPISLPVFRQLSPLLRDEGWQVTVYVREGEIIGLAPADARTLGFAVDLGTTKIAAYLVDLETGEDLAWAGAPNPQIGYGEDVISRLNYALRNPDGAEVLAGKVGRTLDELLGELVAQVGASREQVVDACIVGNTAMTHLLLRLPVSQLARAPYVAAEENALIVTGKEIGLAMAPGATVYIPPSIGGFVGADHIAMLLATEMDHLDRVTIGIDIGTNSEVSLRIPGADFLTSVSCASGPAFEGAHIGDGMRAASGAIEKVRITEEGLALKTIDNFPAVGLCGSGIVDVVAELYGNELINFRGRFDRMREEVSDGHLGAQYLMVPAARSGSNHDIAITQQDINEIQLAKGAINAGIAILLEVTGTAAEDVQEVIIAGAFGSYLNLQNAIRIGLFPELPNAVFRQVGNAAVNGAKRMLISKEARQRAQQMKEHTGYLELTTYPKFSRRFALGMLFPQDGEFLPL